MPLEQHHIKQKVLHITLLFVIVFALEKLVKHWQSARDIYMHWLYYPLQKLRVFLFRDLYFSVGDTIYVILLILSIAAISRCVLTLFKKDKSVIFKELVRLFRWGVIVYSAFVLSWGMNYTREPLLYKYYKDNIVYDPKLKRKKIDYNWNEKELTVFLDSLQNIIMRYMDILKEPKNFETQQINTAAYKYFNTLLAEQHIISPLKNSTLGSNAQRLGIQGYFVPFSGESQYCGNLFYLARPFVFVHEMAHQNGIASETDANLFAYVLCSHVANKAFKGSAYFEVFLYALGDLKRISSKEYFDDYTSQKVAVEIQDILNQMEAHRKQYKSQLRPYSMKFYDHYLKFFGQRDGLKSYSMMTYKVMLFHKHRLSVNEVLDY